MSRFDKTSYDAQLLIVAAPRKGIWGADLKMNGKAARWFAGHLPTSASAHTLLAVAITAALRPLSHRVLMELSEFADRRGNRPRLEIVTNDSTFAEALGAAMRRREATGKTLLRAGKNFLLPLATQLSRWEFVLTTAPESKNLFALSNWAAKVTQDPTIPAVLAPAVISELRA